MRSQQQKKILPRSPSVSSSSRFSFRQLLRHELLEGKLLGSSKSRRRDGSASLSPSPSASFISLEDEDIEHREQMERDRIVAMYDKGPDNPNIGQWERSEWEGYKRIDRYGFVQKDPNFAVQDSPRKVANEIRREKRWLSILKQPRSPPCTHLTDLVWEGIPNKLRIKAWPHLLNVNFFRKVHGGHKIYIELLARARLISKHVKQIDLDISRTYRHHLAFRRRYDVKQQSLFNVLIAYSVYNTEIGYCQGMSQIVALLLMFLDEEDAFWCLHTLMISPKHSMHGFFVSGFPKLQRFETHFKALLKNYEPRVYENFETELIPYFFVTKWWFGCFLDRVPFSLALRIWDTFLLEGDQVLMAMALNIMEMHNKTIKMLSLEKFMEFIQSRLSENFGYSDDEVINNLRRVLYRIRRDNRHPKSPILHEGPQRPFGSVLDHTIMDIHEHVHEIRVQSMNSSSKSRETIKTPKGDLNAKTFSTGPNGDTVLSKTIS